MYIANDVGEKISIIVLNISLNVFVTKTKGLILKIEAKIIGVGSRRKSFPVGVEA